MGSVPISVRGGSCLLARLGARLAQLGGAFLAANLHGFAADLHFDGRLGVEGIVAGRARLLRHGLFSGSPAYWARSGDHSGARGAVEIFSHLGAGAEFGGTHTIMLLERRREMAVARETQVVSKVRQVVPPDDEIERARQAQPQVVAIERQTLHLLEHLREIHGGSADFARDPGQRPAARQISRQQHFRPIYQPAARTTCTRNTRGARPEGARYQSERQSLGFKRFYAALLQ